MTETEFTRVDLIQLFVDKLDAEVYLEIGVNKGTSFLPVKCARKIGVDPDFRVKTKKKIKFLFQDFRNWGNQYHETTSDDFFVRHKHNLASAPPKVVFIDGLHTFEQTLKDCYNSLNCLADGGVIILHDCNPPTEASATPALSPKDAEKKWKVAHPSLAADWTGEWCGDTWKTIPYLINNHPELNVCVLDADYGLGIVSKQKDHNHSTYRVNGNTDEYENFDFSYLLKNKNKILNLKQLGELNEIFALHRP